MAFATCGVGAELQTRCAILWEASHGATMTFLRSFVSCLLLLIFTATGYAKKGRTAQNVAMEITFHSRLHHTDPFNEITLDVVFTDPEEKQWRVPAFWAGGDVWKVRYASRLVGLHSYRSLCNDTKDKGLHGVVGTVQVESYDGKNPLYKHGPLRVKSDKRHLEHEDGTPFFWLGDTWWMGLAKRLEWPEEFKERTADRVKKGFNVVQIVAGLYPDMFPFDPRGANEAGYPWEKEYARINPQYFDRADDRIQYLIDQGIAPCIVGAWGYFLPWMGIEKMEKHWRYLIARYGAMPVVWCAAGEANLPWYLAKGFPYDDREAVHDWTDILRFIRRTDPFHRPLTIHPTAINRYTARHATDDDQLLDFDMLQTPHGRADAARIATNAVRESYSDSTRMPVIDGEAAYEMLSDSLPTEWTRAMFWVCMMNGAAGHTYGGNGIWQNNRPGDPHGRSPNGPGYGNISWQEAIHLPGSSQVAMGKRLFEQYDWQRFEPHPEWATYVSRLGSVRDTGSEAKIEGSYWIWFPEGNPAQNAPVGKRAFRFLLNMPAGKAAHTAWIRFTADDSATVWVNGERLGESNAWGTTTLVQIPSNLLKPGGNVVAVLAENKAAGVAENPAGLIGSIEVRFEDGTQETVPTSKAWKSSQTESPGWHDREFDDSSWPHALEIGSFGDGPWGRILSGKETDQPQSTGIPGKIRFIYCLLPEAVQVRHLGSHSKYRVETFDPVSGETVNFGAGNLTADENGDLTLESPAGNTHDWVLILHFVDSLDTNRQVVKLENDDLSLVLEGVQGRVGTIGIENKLVGHSYRVSRVNELSLTFSAASDQIAAPIVRMADFQAGMPMVRGPTEISWNLDNRTLPIKVTLHYKLVGNTRRKWVDVTNTGKRSLLLLDVGLDDITTDGSTTGGGEGEPVFIDDDLFAAIEHPVGDNAASDGRVQLGHHPGRRILPGTTFHSYVSVIGVTPSGHAREGFVTYIHDRSVRKKKVVSIYTPFGINNQWGAAPSLDDEQVLDVLGLLNSWQKKGFRSDYFTLDTGWVDPDSDLKRFRPAGFPNGPSRIVEQIQTQGMKFGLWFALQWGTQSSWDFPAAYADGIPPGLPYREGYPLTAGGISFCLGTDRYYNLLKSAVLHHVQANHVRLLKFDGGLDGCNDPTHGHLPGKYSKELMTDRLIDIADSARKLAPDLFVMWYWGLKSPFWALHGDTIFESGVNMEGSATSSTPTLYYRDSVTLAQDQNAQFASNIPPIVKDSLGVWLAENRWGNFMGKERWRESVVMDLGRGNLVFPNLWGNLYSFTDDDVRFLARIAALAKGNEGILRQPRHLVGSAWKNSPYGYSYFLGTHGFVFLNNPSFTSRSVELQLDEAIGLEARNGSQVQILSHFPDLRSILRSDGSDYRIGERVIVWLRPFETLMLEVRPPIGKAVHPSREIDGPQAADLGRRLLLSSGPVDPRLAVEFADAARFVQKGFVKKTLTYEATMPSLTGAQPILAVVIRLRRGDDEWRYAPKPVEIVQALLKVGDQNVGLIPMPDGRQFGNTQSYGTSWMIYKVRLNPKWAGKKIKIAVHAYLPPGVSAIVESWVVKRWWQENTRPQGDGYYTDAPS